MKRKFALLGLIFGLCISSSYAGPVPLAAQKAYAQGETGFMLSIYNTTLTFTNESAAGISVAIDVPPSVVVHGPWLFHQAFSNGGVTLAGCGGTAALAGGSGVVCDVAASGTLTITYDPTACPSNMAGCYGGTKGSYRIL